MKKRYRLKKKFLIIILLFFICIFGYSLFHVYGWMDDNHKTKKIKEEIDNNINIDVDEGIFEVDFDGLTKINSDTVGYLIINNTEVSYPVVKTDNNVYYLDHSFYKNKSEAGWLFMDYKNKLDGYDKNIIIYGHNRLDGIMFGTLKKVLDEDWYTNEDNLTIRFITKEKTIEYKIFSMYKIKEEEYYIKTNFDDNSFPSFVNKLESRSVYNFGNDLSQVKQILTLSTCTLIDEYRFVVHAYKV